MRLGSKVGPAMAEPTGPVPPGLHMSVRRITEAECICLSSITSECTSDKFLKILLTSFSLDDVDHEIYKVQNYC